MTAFKRVETVAIIVGAVVGAGFATGKEINLYFQGKSLCSPAISALVFGGLTALFLLAGRLDGGEEHTIISSAMVELSSTIVFGAMSACFCTLLGGRTYGVIISLLCVVLSEKSKAFGVINTLLVVLIIVLVLSHLTPERTVTGHGFGVGSAVSYATLNFMTAGALVKARGRSATKRDVWTVSVSVACVMAVLACSMLVLVNGATGDLPFMDVATKMGTQIPAFIVILSAVLSTQLATASVLVNSRLLSGGAGWIKMAFLGAIALLGAMLGFDFVVKVGYPIVSLCGLAYVIMTAVDVIKKRGARMRAPL